MNDGCMRPHGECGTCRWYVQCCIYQPAKFLRWLREWAKRQQSVEQWQSGKAWALLFEHGIPCGEAE